VLCSKSSGKTAASLLNYGKKHDQYMQPKNGKFDQVPRHNDIAEDTAKSIIKNLAWP